MTKTIYHYHPVTGQFVGVGTADISPADKELTYLIPANATDIELPDSQEGFVRQFNPDKQQWFQAPILEATEQDKAELADGKIVLSRTIALSAEAETLDDDPPPEDPGFDFPTQVAIYIDTAISAGFNLDGIRVSRADFSMLFVDGLGVQANAAIDAGVSASTMDWLDSGQPFVWVLSDNSVHEMNAHQVASLHHAWVTHQQRYMVRARELLLMNPTPENWEDPSFWPSIDYTTPEGFMP